MRKDSDSVNVKVTKVLSFFTPAPPPSTGSHLGGLGRGCRMSPEVTLVSDWTILTPPVAQGWGERVRVVLFVEVTHQWTGN